MDVAATIVEFVRGTSLHPPTTAEVGVALTGGYGPGMTPFESNALLGALRSHKRTVVAAETMNCVERGELFVDAQLRLQVPAAPRAPPAGAPPQPQPSRPLPVPKRPFTGLRPDAAPAGGAADGGALKRVRAAAAVGEPAAGARAAGAPPPRTATPLATVAATLLRDDVSEGAAPWMEAEPGDDGTDAPAADGNGGVAAEAAATAASRPRAGAAAPFRPPRPAGPPLPPAPARRAGGAGVGGDDVGPPLGPEQQFVYDRVMEGRSLLVTGSAGCGKTVLLRRLIADLRDRFVAAGKPDALVVTATTGIAACALGGTTLHSFAGVGQGGGDGYKLAAEIERKPTVAKRWKSARVLIVDEVSMLDGDLLDKLELVARRVRHNEAPFGGIQLVLGGDFLQLPPVADDGGFGGGRGGGGGGGGGGGARVGAAAAPPPPGGVRFAFEAKCWPRIVSATVCLQRIYRQGGDTAFIELLNSLRVGVVPPAAAAMLAAAGRTVGELERAGGVRATRVFARNTDVDRVNSAELSKCGGSAFEFVARDSGPDEAAVRNLARSCPAPERLVLKVGAQVMLLKNVDAERGLVNGARGVVTTFATNAAGPWPPALPMVSFERGPGVPPVVVAVEAAEWTTEVGGTTLATRQQLPLKLAYALSVHKSQGMGISLLDVDLAGVFEYGQSFVALSRAVSLDRVRVRNFSPQCVRAHPRVLDFYRSVGGLPAVAAVGGGGGSGGAARLAPAGGAFVATGGGVRGLPQPPQEQLQQRQLSRPPAPPAAVASGAAASAQHARSAPAAAIAGAAAPMRAAGARGVGAPLVPRLPACDDLTGFEDAFGDDEWTPT